MNKVAPNKYPTRVREELKRVDQVVDGLGKHVDADIKLLVATLLSLGFATSGSCSGHLERPLTKGPWVDIESPKAMSLFSEKIASAPNSWKKDFTNPDYKELIEKVRLLNTRARAALMSLMSEFYENRTSPFNVRLMLDTKSGTGSFRLQCQGAETARLPESMAEYPQWLRDAQAEMNDFAEFLCIKVDSTLLHA